MNNASIASKKSIKDPEVKVEEEEKKIEKSQELISPDEPKKES